MSIELDIIAICEATDGPVADLDIMGQLSARNRGSVRTMIYRMINAGVLVRVGRSEVRLAKGDGQVREPQPWEDRSLPAYTRVKLYLQARGPRTPQRIRLATGVGRDALEEMVASREAHWPGDGTLTLGPNPRAPKKPHKANRWASNLPPDDRKVAS
ncbi:MAG: hypothetical protein K2Y51_26125 [Gammaproteobacteria bacterium]|nr:hypothetical protein [Gammaproteobacteria bacterium]